MPSIEMHEPQDHKTLFLCPGDCSPAGDLALASPSGGSPARSILPDLPRPRWELCSHQSLPSLYHLQFYLNNTMNGFIGVYKGWGRHITYCVPDVV